MKIKSVILLAIISATIATAQANPFQLIHDVVVAVDNNLGPAALLGHNKRQPIVTTYYEKNNCAPVYHAPRYNHSSRQEDGFHRKVTYVDRDGCTSKGNPPPEAYKYVAYPGPAPKYLYNDPNIRVQDRGNMHYVIYRKPGW